MWGVKFYTSMNPAWIAPAAAEAHKLGLHVHGHVPAGMRPLDAVRAGYDEVTHINFIMMQAMPQDVVDKANTAARLEGPAKYGKDVDLDSPAMKAFYAELSKRRHDHRSDAYRLGAADDFGRQLRSRQNMRRSPTSRRRRLCAVGRSAAIRCSTVSRATISARASTRWSDWSTRLHKAGVRIVAGTDGYGLELVRELELYQQAGLTNAEALQTATIVPARMTGMDDRVGSIARARPRTSSWSMATCRRTSRNLRHVDTVFLDGYRLDGKQLREASGLTGMPK